jgi:hypothetical protein
VALGSLKGWWSIVKRQKERDVAITYVTPGPYGKVRRLVEEGVIRPDVHQPEFELVRDMGKTILDLSLLSAPAHLLRARDAANARVTPQHYFQRSCHRSLLGALPNSLHCVISSPISRWLAGVFTWPPQANEGEPLGPVGL